MKISILGCGWLGLPLAKSLLDQGHHIKGTTTASSKIEKLENNGIEAFLLELNPKVTCDNCTPFWNSDLLVLNIPPGRGRKDILDYHTSQISSVIEQVISSTISKVVFVSSTSVYPELPGVVEEKDAVPGKAGRDSGNALFQAESMLAQETNFDTTIIRFGGLYGYDRHPAKYLAGKKNLARAKAPVNLIHRDDCIQVISRIIEELMEGEVFNAVSDGHPPRKMYYTAAAKVMGLEPPTFKIDSGKNYKVVSNKKLKRILNYRFIHPNPMDNLYS